MSWSQPPLFGTAPPHHRMYVGRVMANHYTLKVGWTEAIAKRVRQHRRQGIIVLASWVADYDEEQRFHRLHRSDQDRSVGRRECYWPTWKVVDALVYLMEQAASAGQWHAEDSKVIWQLSDATNEINTCAMYLAAHPDIRIERERNPRGFQTDSE